MTESTMNAITMRRVKGLESGECPAMATKGPTIQIKAMIKRTPRTTKIQRGGRRHVKRDRTDIT